MPNTDSEPDSDNSCKACKCCTACELFCSVHNPTKYYNPYKLIWTPYVHMPHVWHTGNERFWWIMPNTCKFQWCDILLIDDKNVLRQQVSWEYCVFSLVPPPNVSEKVQYLSLNSKLAKSPPESSSDLPVPIGSNIAERNTFGSSTIIMC